MTETASRLMVNLVASAQNGATGISRYARELQAGLVRGGVAVRVVRPNSIKLPGPLADFLKAHGADVETFFGSYPLTAPVPQEGVAHLASQNLATLLWFRKMGPVVVTVHDIIPHLLRNDRRLSSYAHPIHRLFDRLAVGALGKADYIIADSSYTKEVLADQLRFPRERIKVVCLGVDHNSFKPLDVPQAFRDKYGLDKALEYILYVGSEDPRKNLETLVRAFAQMREQRRDIRLLKIVPTQSLLWHERLIRLMTNLGITDSVICLGEVPEEDLPLFYNVADILALPSLYEGFGLPALEAMACGTPVVASNASSIPEVVDNAGLLADPHDPEEWAKQMACVLESPNLASTLKDRGLRRAGEFSWGRTAEETANVYCTL